MVPPKRSMRKYPSGSTLLTSAPISSLCAMSTSLGEVWRPLRRAYKLPIESTSTESAKGTKASRKYATTGCSNFRSSRHLDVTPFAENTINMVAEISYGLDTNSAVYLRRYRGGDTAKAYRAHWEYFRPILRGIGIYSLGLVTISRSNITEKEKAEQLAEFMDRLFARNLAAKENRLSLSPERMNEIIADVREQKSFLDALGAAQPVIDEVARFSGDYLDLILTSQDEVQDWLINTIDEHDDAVEPQRLKETLELEQEFITVVRPPLVRQRLTRQLACRESAQNFAQRTQSAIASPHVPHDAPAKPIAFEKADDKRQPASHGDTVGPRRAEPLPFPPIDDDGQDQH